MSYTILLDGDITAYQFAATHERAINWGDDLWTLHCHADEACAAMDSYLAKLQEDLEADCMVIALSDVSNFRMDVLPTYKQNRKKTRKPVCLPQMRRHMLDNYETFLRPGLEGDDVLGILQTSKKLVPGEKVMFSIDKDMLTIPGLCLNMNLAKSLLEDGAAETMAEARALATREVTEGQANFMHLFQTLTGDATDGYKGCPGVGPKRALEMLGADKDLDFRTDDLPSIPTASVPDVWAAVIIPLFAGAKLGEEEALTQARVARILRRTDYDFKAKRPILWKPGR